MGRGILLLEEHATQPYGKHLASLVRRQRLLKVSLQRNGQCTRHSDFERPVTVSIHIHKYKGHTASLRSW